MARLTRRHFTMGAAAAGVATFSIGGARAAEFTYKFANNLALTHPVNKRAQEAAEKIKEETKGRFELQIFPSSQLGSDTDTLGQIRNGAVDFFTLSGLILSTLVPAAAISGVDTPLRPSSASKGAAARACRAKIEAVKRARMSVRICV